MALLQITSYRTAAHRSAGDPAEEGGLEAGLEAGFGAEVGHEFLNAALEGAGADVELFGGGGVGDAGGEQGEESEVFLGGGVGRVGGGVFAAQGEGEGALPEHLEEGDERAEQAGGVDQ